ncbi:alpha/beta hydrolase [Paenibacillus sp. GSMTC-2017]|uniref:alpha/beta hydrolase n=1 Tax=Paenibacillus sp. GSMTC-2017 TaxID=2794350 RepID=UPI0018D8EA13|nr:alpha/beta hydrolase [Paenibacillus sp. GSMTC-2017]MBH5317822.1 alpha/beta hydrolase [Paenibacillus sp. GSMTC-2017]
MKKILRILLKTVIVIVLLIVLFIAIVFIANKISNKSDLKKIDTYGQLVPVDGKNMNVLIEGEGEETIVLLPGYGTASPALDFTPLLKELTPFYKVVVVEPFGYGLSDGTDKERTSENITNEIHEALQSLNIDRYILMGHSITGIYGLEYINKFENEVSAFIGIDTSVPTQDGMDTEFPIGTFKLLKSSGFGRLMLKFGPDPFEGLPFDDKTKKQLRLITLRNMYEPTTLNEMEHFSQNFKSAQRLKFPNNMPLLLFIQGGVNEGQENWIPLHEEQAKDSIHGEVVKLDGGHYLHHTHSKEIAEGLKVYMEKMKSI